MQASVYEGEATGPFIATLAPYNQGGEKLDMFGGRTSVGDHVYFLVRREKS